MAPLEPGEKVLVQGEDFYATVHGQIACGFCHSGVNSAEKETAHTGLLLDPSSAPNRVCDTCHHDTEMAATSLHGTLQGYWTAIEARGGSRPQYDAHRVEMLLEMYDQHCGTCHTNCEQCHYSFPGSEEMLVKQDAVGALLAKVDHIAELNAMIASPEEHATQTMFNNHCSSCHASCGDCHISQPSSVGGGFVSGHVISKTPSMSQNCTACHGLSILHWAATHSITTPAPHALQHPICLFLGHQTIFGCCKCIRVYSIHEIRQSFQQYTVICAI